MKEGKEDERKNKKFSIYGFRHYTDTIIRHIIKMTVIFYCFCRISVIFKFVPVLSF